MQGFGGRPSGAAGPRLAFFTRALAVLLGVSVAARAYAAEWGPLWSGAAGFVTWLLAALALEALLRGYARLVAPEAEDETPPAIPPTPQPEDGLVGLRRGRRGSGRRLLADARDPADPDGER